MIDCDKDAKIPYVGWKIESHIKGGKLKWNPDNVSLWLSDEQKTRYVKGSELKEKIPNGALNANVLDYLFKHQELIPESWKENTKDGFTQFIFFWGTIYRHPSDGNLCVRCLYWHGGAWNHDCGWLGDGWGGDNPAALLASTQKLGTKTSSDTQSLVLPESLVINGIKYTRDE